MNASNANRQIARAAGTVMIAILFGQLAGLVRGILVARVFGASPELDAFFAANRVSETVFLLVAGGALGSAFIPTFTGLLARHEKDSAWRLASALANLVTLVLSLLSKFDADKVKLKLSADVFNTSSHPNIQYQYKTNHLTGLFTTIALDYDF